MTLLVAGHETTASGPRLVLRERFSARAGRAAADGPRRPTAGRTGRRTSSATVQETLRVRPVIPAVLRQLKAPVQLGGYSCPPASP